ncbi:MAG TPA: peptide chain release factor N(5)-glutamine methyltransferase [Thermomicrobiales bacterium]|nr:peptide chain release factor N(5)-glutamine methyltransferase [Thermomicrobiales bacterium]
MNQPTPTIADALAAATAELAAAGSETARLDAEVLLRHLLGIDRTALFVRLREPLAAEAARRFAQIVARRTSGEPVAYLTGEREFVGLPFRVAPGVLIPRPETEILVGWALAWLGERPAARVVDIGTGSGAIALSLARLLPPACRGSLVAADISPAALQIAAHNRAALGVIDRVQLVRGDLATWLGAPVDLILANLPYLRPAQIAANRWLAAEPALALAGGADGLALVRRLVADLPRVLAPGGAAGFEIDPSQAGAVAALLATALPDGAVSVLPDLASLDRHVVVERPGGAAGGGE